MVRRIDYHIHTKLCNHATGEMEEYVQAAISKSLDEMGFADHFPMVYLPKSLPLENYSMKLEELPLYIQSVKNLQEKYPDIIIRLGIEADYYEGKEKEIEELLKKVQFDYIYGSVHVVDDWVIDDDRYRKKYQEYDLFILNQKYFSNLKKAIQSGLYDVIAHFDLPKKYGDRPKKSIEEFINEIIEALAKRKVCVELNTSGFRKPAKEQYPSSNILQSCYENDIQVTIGSDSHKPEEVGWELERALKVLREVGYSQIVGFEKRKVIFFEI
ncbi:MAG: histidinol-phosphatase HisJ family protein [Candidatus Helarchaeota archaeon]|nr:histidinol-phosphatase HisJ family protein [Candidatus Helarchaeota archaeon]